MQTSGRRNFHFSLFKWNETSGSPKFVNSYSLQWGGLKYIHIYSYLWKACRVCIRIVYIHTECRNSFEYIFHFHSEKNITSPTQRASSNFQPKCLSFKVANTIGLLNMYIFTFSVEFWGLFINPHTNEWAWSRLVLVVIMELPYTTNDVRTSSCRFYSRLSRKDSYGALLEVLSREIYAHSVWFNISHNL